MDDVRNLTLRVSLLEKMVEMLLGMHPCRCGFRKELCKSCKVKRLRNACQAYDFDTSCQDGERYISLELTDGRRLTFAMKALGLTDSFYEIELSEDGFYLTLNGKKVTIDKIIGESRNDK